MPEIEPAEARRIALIELNALGIAGSLPDDRLLGAEVASEATAIHDINGEVLFYRLPVVNGRRDVAFVDIAAHAALGDPLIGVSLGPSWNPEAIAGQAREQARRRRLKVDGAEVRFVAYSYPKVAVQFRSRGEELALLEWMTWEPVPSRSPRQRRADMQPDSFERWSLIDELPDELLERRREQYATRLRMLSEVRFDLESWTIEPHRWVEILVLKLVDTREVRYSLRQSHHTPCYELRGQETNVWCVGASAQMLLDFYRYEYTQTRLAQQLGLGTPGNPNGLPYSQVASVVTALEALTSDGLSVTMVTDPEFKLFRDEIRANRPVISFVPGHSRTVAGYTESLITLINQSPYRGLLVYDPWPPNAGVITRWENFATQTYQFAYTAEVGTIT